MSARTVIEVENLAKLYRLGTINHGTLYQDLQSWWARYRGRADPNSQIMEGGLSGKGRAVNDKFLALEDISFEVAEGEVLGIIGQNGAGKSTLLKILSRVTAPTSGEVRLRGRVASLLEVGTGFHPELTGRDNIFLNGAILGMNKREIRSKLDEIVAFAEVDKFIDTPVKRYSSGMYVRLAFGVAAHLEPEILIVDEVLAVGDFRFQRKCLGKMQEVGRTGRTVLFVSHNMGAIRSLCSRAISLADGKMIRDGETDSVVEEYLATGMKSSATESYPDDPGKAIHVSRMTLIDEDENPSSYLDMLKPFTVEVEYLVNTPVSGVVVAVNVFTQHGECLIATADHDLNRDRLGTRTEGRHTTRVTIPGSLVNSGVYQVVVGISVPGKYIYDRREGMTFELYDSGSFVVSGGGEERRNSVLLLGLDWEDR